ncbi:zonadhesin-like [Saccoglossus kowalevskii]|uniref:Mucin-6-like n=1 Tax=Saccoglossus kowalevskii TaxID=10224 RepID=A0ABM0MG90_SACKO|nr:PREDICTED: mucin-6-like [Saccoglossus kowalevskii]
MQRCLIVSCLVILAIACQSNAKVVKRAEGNPHDLMVPGQGQANKCLQCKLSDKMTLAECLLKPESDPDKYEYCTTARPECMTQLWQKNTGLVFISECQQIEACIEESENEPNFNECDEAPIYVKTKCRYCCGNNTITQGYYCPPPRVPAVTCTVHGDPRFCTFDGYKYHEGGDCAMYSLMHMACGNDFRIDVKVTEHKTKDHYRVGSLLLIQGGETFTLGPNDGVNPVTYLLTGGLLLPIDDSVLPKYYGTSDQFLLSKHSDTYHVTMDLELDGYYDVIVRWGVRRVAIDLYQPYSQCYVIHGLCGDANGSPEFERITSDGVNATTDGEFHRSWGEGNGCGTLAGHYT